MKIDMVEWKSLFDGLSTILSKSEIKEMLKEKYSDGVNILGHYRKFLYEDRVSRDLLPFLQTILTSDEIKNLLFDVDGEGKIYFNAQLSSQEIPNLNQLVKQSRKI